MKLKKYDINTGTYYGILRGCIEYDKNPPRWFVLKLDAPECNACITIPFGAIDRYIEVLNAVKKSKEYGMWETQKKPKVFTASCAIQTSDVAVCNFHTLGKDNEGYCTSKKRCEYQRPIKFKRGKFGEKVYERYL